MFEIKDPEFLRVLEELGVTFQDYVQLRGELTSAEARKVGKVQCMETEVLVIAEILNSRRRLPERLRHLVKTYNGFSGEPHEDILL